jgi:hypothetical protein
LRFAQSGILCAHSSVPAKMEETGIKPVEVSG